MSLSPVRPAVRAPPSERGASAQVKEMRKTGQLPHTERADQANQRVAESELWTEKQDEPQMEEYEFRSLVDSVYQAIQRPASKMGMPVQSSDVLAPIKQLGHNAKAFIINLNSTPAAHRRRPTSSPSQVSTSPGKETSPETHPAVTPEGMIPSETPLPGRASAPTPSRQLPALFWEHAVTPERVSAPGIPLPGPQLEEYEFHQQQQQRQEEAKEQEAEEEVHAQNEKTTYYLLRTRGY